MKGASENVGVKTLVDIPFSRLHSGWLYPWPSIANFRTDYITRACVARLGLTANTLEETVCIALHYYGENKPLMGENNYTLTLIPPPFKEPGFWSITMYDYKNNYPVKNPINLYSLGSDTPLIKNTNLGTIRYDQT